MKIIKCTVTHCIMMFRSTMDRTYDGGPVRLYYYNIILRQGCSEKCVIRRFGHFANITECTYTNLDSIAY